MSSSPVVRIYATTQAPDYECPWQASSPSSSTGSGVVIGAQEILTGAHVVANSTFLRVQKISAPDKAIATVKAICHDADLALLSVSDPEFLEDLEPAEIGDLPDLRDKVAVEGFPVGGEEVSITEGVVSRIEIQTYTHSDRDMLAVTVDAAINEGNSGGPVIKDDRVVGIAFQTLNDAENIGEMVPAPVIKRFLAGIEQKKHAEVPGLGIAVQTLENPMLRRHLGLEPGQGGVLVLEIQYGGSAWGRLEAGDTILAVGDHPVSANGTIRYQGRYRTRFEALLGDHYVGDTIALTVIRKGEKRTVELELTPLRHLVPRAQHDVRPTYFIFGGFVFQPLSRDYLATWDDYWWDRAPKEFLHYYYSGVRTQKKLEIVVLTQVLADETNVGYEDVFNEAIKSINGVEPRDMQEFVRLMENANQKIELRTTDNALIVLEVDAVRAAHERILKRYQVTRDRSANLSNGQ